MNKKRKNGVILVINVPVAPYIHNSNQNEIKIEQINKLYTSLANEIKEVILENLDKDEYVNKITKEIDYRPISHLITDVYKETISEDKNYMIYQKSKEKAIVQTLRYDSYRLDEKRLESLLNIYFEDLEEEKEYLDIKTIGTTLNALREFYPDLYSSINRIKKNGLKSKQENYLQYFSHKLFDVNEDLKSREKQYILNFSRGKIDD